MRVLRRLVPPDSHLRGPGSTRAAVDTDSGRERMIEWVKDLVATPLVVVDGEPEA
jgi:hypothetical protein